MNIDEIRNLLWWNPLVYSPQMGIGQYILRTRDEGRIGFTTGINVIWADNPPRIVTNYNLNKASKKLNFVVDCPAHDIHVEQGIPITDRTLKIPQQDFWKTESGRYFGKFYVSLRIAGYLVDCWEYDGGCEIRDGHIVFDSNQFERVVTHWRPKGYQFYKATVTKDGMFKPYIVGEFHSRQARHIPEEKVQFRLFSRNFTSSNKMDDMIASFNQHPRNFFLSFVR